MRGIRGSRRQWRLRRAGVLATVVAGAAVLAAACSGGSASLAGSGRSALQAALAYAACMRSHGAPNWPDPNSHGQFLKTRANRAEFHAPASAYNACQHLLPNGGQITAAMQQKITALALKFTACMHAHGITDFPDPIGSGFEFDPPQGYNPHSPRVQAAQQACQHYASAAGKDIPPG